MKLILFLFPNFCSFFANELTLYNLLKMPARKQSVFFHDKNLERNYYFYSPDSVWLTDCLDFCSSFSDDNDGYELMATLILVFYSSCFFLCFHKLYHFRNDVSENNRTSNMQRKWVMRMTMDSRDESSLLKYFFSCVSWWSRLEE